MVLKENPEQTFLATLHRHEPVSVQELCEVTGVTATAVRQRLLRLQSEGLVTRQIVRQERGRPHHTYALTSLGLKSLGDNQGEMAAILWQEVMRIDQPEVKNQVLTGVRDALVQRIGLRAVTGSLSERLHEMCSNLTEFGFDVECLPEASPVNTVSTINTVNLETAEAGLPVLREHNCPYHEIAAVDPSICEFEQSVFSELLGADVELSACRLDGHRCCEFQVRAN